MYTLIATVYNDVLALDSLIRRESYNNDKPSAATTATITTLCPCIDTSMANHLAIRPALMALFHVGAMNVHYLFRYTIGALASLILPSNCATKMTNNFVMEILELFDVLLYSHLRTNSFDAATISKC